MTDEQYVEAARNYYQGTAEVDKGAVVSRGSDRGAYVAAWVWVADDSLPDGEGSHDDPDRPEAYR